MGAFRLTGIGGGSAAQGRPFNRYCVIDVASNKQKVWIITGMLRELSNFREPEAARSHTRN